jgi:hypothetical protein
MSGDCYFCHGLVFPAEEDDILLDGHADHEVYMHRRCAVGHDVIEAASAADDERDGRDGPQTVVCPECGTTESY